VDFGYDDFVAFFEAKKKGVYECPFCGHKHFVTAQGPNQQAGSLVIPTMPPPGLVNPSAPYYHEFIAVICTNCGHTDLFHHSILLDWKSAKKLTSGGA